MTTPIGIADVGVEINVSLELQIGNNLSVEAEEYAGAYTFVPKVESQEIETKDKILRRNVDILEIPKHEFDNLSGTTVVIGGML